MPASGGMAAKNFWKASRPPAEAPMPTTGNNSLPAGGVIGERAFLARPGLEEDARPFRERSGWRRVPALRGLAMVSPGPWGGYRWTSATPTNTSIPPTTVVTLTLSPSRTAAAASVTSGSRYRKAATFEASIRSSAPYQKR